MTTLDTRANPACNWGLGYDKCYIPGEHIHAAVLSTIPQRVRDRHLHWIIRKMSWYVLWCSSNVSLHRRWSVCLLVFAYLHVKEVSINQTHAAADSTIFASKHSKNIQFQRCFMSQSPGRSVCRFIQIYRDLATCKMMWSGVHHVDLCGTTSRLLVINWLIIYGHMLVSP